MEKVGGTKNSPKLKHGRSVTARNSLRIWTNLLTSHFLCFFTLVIFSHEIVIENRGSTAEGNSAEFCGILRNSARFCPVVPGSSDVPGNEPGPIYRRPVGQDDVSMNKAQLPQLKKET